MQIFTTHQTHKVITLLIASIVVLIPLVYWPTLRDYTLGPKLFVFQTLLAFILFFWLLAPKKPIHIPALSFPALAFVLVAFLSTLWATHTEVAILEGTKYLTGFIFFLILANHLTPNNIPQILTASTWTGIFVALLITCDYLGFRPLNIPSAGLPSATLGYRNLAAMYLIQVLPFAVALFVLTKTRHTALINATAISLISVSILYTRTRGAWLGITIAILLVATLWYWLTKEEVKQSFDKSKRHIIGIAVLFFGLALLPSNLTKQGPQSIDEKKTTVTDAIGSILQTGGDRGRLTTWRNTLPMIVEHPMLGVGLGNWSVYYPYYDRGELVTFQVAPERPHNTFLAILSEIGLIGFMCFLWFWIAVVKTGWHLIQTPCHHTRWIAAAGLTSFIAITIHSIFSFPFERATPTLFFWLVPGLFAALQQPDKRHSHNITTTTLTWMLTVIMIAQLILTSRLLQFETHMYRAVKAEQTSNWAHVATETQNALAHGVFHVEGLHLHGYALNALSQFHAAKIHYQKAVAKRPYDVQILNGLAIAAQNLNETNTAKTRYREALAIVNSPDIYYNLAGLFLQSGQPDSAIAAYHQVMQMEGPSLDLYYHLAHAYLFNEQIPQAEQMLQRAFAYDTQAIKHFEWIETLYYKHQKTPIARACYTIFITYCPGDTRALQQAQKRLQELQTLQ